MNHHEDAEQYIVAEFIRRQYPKVLFTISPVSMISGMRRAIRAKRLGYGVGTPDMMIFHPAGHYHGLFIEMKRPPEKYIGRDGKEHLRYKGAPSQEQKNWNADLNGLGYQAWICYGAKEAIECIRGYMGLGEGER